MSKYYLGVDHHAAHSTCCLMDREGNVFKQRKILNTPEALDNFLADYGPQTQGVLEAGRNWTIMYDRLAKRLESVALAHPWKVRLIAETRLKSDKIDSRQLAHLLRTNFLPRAHVPSMKALAARQILRQRVFLVKIQTMTKNRVRILLARYPDLPLSEAPVKGIFSQKGIIWLKKQKSSFKTHDQAVLFQDLTLLESVQEQVKVSDKLVNQLAAEDPQIKNLKTLPGFGNFFACLLKAEIDDVNRFPDAKKLQAYAGLIPSTYASGNRLVHGRMTKQGNRFLRWAFIEAVWPATRKDRELRKYYQKHKERCGPNPAKVITARRLALIAYKILKENRPYHIRQSS